MTKNIGIVACSAEGAALCYRTICAEGPALMGEHMHPEVCMHTHPLGEYMVHIRSGDWMEVARLMLSSARKLAEIGAEIAICPDNTVHQAFDLVAADSPIPWLHIAEVVGRKAKRLEYKTIGVLGTKYLMNGPVYPQALKKYDVLCKFPDKQDREQIDKIIFEQLVNGVIKDESRLYFYDVMRKLKSRGCGAIVLGCTEIPLLVNPKECPLLTLDSTRLLSRAALDAALGADRQAL